MLYIVFFEKFWSLYLYVLNLQCLLWMDVNGEVLKRGYIYIKGVTVRFDFDDVRISQIPNVSQEQSNGDALWGVLYILILAWMLSSVLLLSNNVYHRRGAFSVVH